MDLGSPVDSNCVVAVCVLCLFLMVLCVGHFLTILTFCLYFFVHDVLTFCLYSFVHDVLALFSISK